MSIVCVCVGSACFNVYVFVSVYGMHGMHWVYGVYEVYGVYDFVCPRVSPCVLQICVSKFCAQSIIGSVHSDALLRQKVVLVVKYSSSRILWSGTIPRILKESFLPSSLLFL